MAKPKGRRVPPVQPGERRQHASGELVAAMDPVVRKNVTMLAKAGFERDGRGLLIVELDDDTEHGIVGGQYFSLERLSELHRDLPVAQSQPISEAVNTYNPEREFVVLVYDTTRNLPGPQMWFDLFPRDDVET